MSRMPAEMAWELRSLRTRVVSLDNTGLVELRDKLSLAMQHVSSPYNMPP